MSAQQSLSAFNPKDERDIPPWPSSEPVPATEERVYVLGMRTVAGRIEFYFVERPKSPDPSNDGPLQIRVPTDCVIVLRLDSSWKWEFRHQNAVTLGPMGYPDNPRYFNLESKIADGLCKEVRFNAIYLPISEANTDPYALYVQLEQENAKGVVEVPLLLRIDPDITNPGDHH
jgi:hypothetical protein